MYSCPGRSGGRPWRQTRSGDGLALVDEGDKALTPPVPEKSSSFAGALVLEANAPLFKAQLARAFVQDFVMEITVFLKMSVSGKSG
jgi:hypothetical protein